MIQRALVTFALFVSLPLSLLSFDTQALSQDRAWLRLLHFRDGKSEIDSSNFFLSPKGKTDAKAELDAMIEAIYHDSSVFCRFPARVKWLFLHLPQLEAEVRYQPCPALEALKAQFQTQKAVLIFPTAHINSPASMFGHTFLRLDDKKGLVLTSNAVNYAAKTQESNGLIFAYQGLFGGYEGRYSVLPYYKKIKEYNNLERRDIWEYTLNLDEAELGRLLDHLYELKDTYADYFFFTENCSYNLLWLLEVARDDVVLVEQFSIKAIPIDTIRVIEEAGLIEGVHFRPSKTKRILALKEAAEERDTLQKAYQAELEVELLQLKRTQKKVEKKAYIDRLMGLLQKRSKLPKLPPLEIKEPANPLKAHKSTRVSLGLDDAGKTTLGMKLAFHDLYDVDQGFVSGAYIDFFHLILQKERGGDITLEKLDLVNINSYAARDSIFKPISWGVAFGMRRFREASNFSLRGEVGVSYALGEGALGFIMMAPKFYYHDNAVVGVAPKLGVLASFERVKLGLIGERNFYSDGGDDFEAELFSTIMISKQYALNLKLSTLKEEDTKSDQRLGISLFYYF